MTNKKYAYVEVGEYQGLVGEVLEIVSCRGFAPEALMKSPSLLERNDSDEYWVYEKYITILNTHEVQQYQQVNQ